MDPEREAVAERDAGETPHGLSRRHDVRRNLVRVRIAKAEAGGFDCDVAAEDLPAACEARIAALERLAGKQALASAVVKRGASADPRRQARLHPR